MRRVTCDVTGLACTNQQIVSCLPDSIDRLILTGHYDRNGTLNTLPSLPILNDLTLQGGLIKNVKEGAFATSASVQWLSLNHNSIRTVGNWFDGLEDMERLFLAWNKIEHIERGAFRPLHGLQFLDLSDNMIRKVEVWFFEGLSSLIDLKLKRNKISRVAANAFNYLRIHTLDLSFNMLKTLSWEWLQMLPQLARIYLNDNHLPTVGQESLVALSDKFVRLYNNPFRCTCALISLKTEGVTILGQGRTDNLYCSYPPHLAGKKVLQVSREDMPCPPPVAKVSRADNGTTLLCQVYWEQQPDISWVGPEGNNISASSNTSGNGMTTHSEHDMTPEGHSLPIGTDCSSHHTESSTLNFMGKSTYKLHLSQEAFLGWTEGAYRCVITYPVGNFSVSMGLSLTNPKANDSRSLTSDDEEEGVISTTEKMPMEYFILSPRQHLQHPCLLNLIYTGVIAVSVSLLVGFLVGRLMSNVSPPKHPDCPAMSESSPLSPSAMGDSSPFPPSHRSTLCSLHHYEVIPDHLSFAPLSPYAQVFLNPQYGQGNAKLRSSKRKDVFLNPQYGRGNVKHTEIFVNPQYSQGQVRLNYKRRWSTPVQLPCIDQVVAVRQSFEHEHPRVDEKAKLGQNLPLVDLRRDLRVTGINKSPIPASHRYTLP
ncbi:LRFN5 [Branchiostoma lanceolatum]|uniref:LRFN5 protein n=1 Tax=Branchiostoma lanceolatum TaxID=7740 RepID=A0A8J9VIV2_BRALA|nr:LRFN5 [Branchiostoma lanceolatum]